MREKLNQTKIFAREKKFFFFRHIYLPPCKKYAGKNKNKRQIKIRRVRKGKVVVRPKATIK